MDYCGGALGRLVSISPDAGPYAPGLIIKLNSTALSKSRRRVMEIPQPWPALADLHAHAQRRGRLMSLQEAKGAKAPGNWKFAHVSALDVDGMGVRPRGLCESKRRCHDAPPSAGTRALITGA